MGAQEPSPQRARELIFLSNIQKRAYQSMRSFLYIPKEDTCNKSDIKKNT